jgi:hypothetical protein
MVYGCSNIMHSSEMCACHTVPNSRAHRHFGIKNYNTENVLFAKTEKL